MQPDRPDVPDWDALDDALRRALAEDVGAGDVTTAATVPEDLRAEGTFLAKEPGVVAGLAVAARVFALVDPAVEVAWAVADGAAVEAGTRVGAARGAARSLLVAERVALNLLQRMSGIATATRAMADAAAPARVLDTRKTAPGLRAFDRWAVRLGGGVNHRWGLADMILVKDNHIEAAGGVAAAVRAARAWRAAHAPEMEIEIEARTLAEVDAVVAAHEEAPRGEGVGRVLLDNMVAVREDGTVDATMLAEAARRIAGRITTEASGNVTLQTAGAVGRTGVDFVSSGALTHSVRALDLSMKIRLLR